MYIEDCGCKLNLRILIERGAFVVTPQVAMMIILRHKQDEGLLTEQEKHAIREAGGIEKAVESLRILPKRNAIQDAMNILNNVADCFYVADFHGSVETLYITSDVKEPFCQVDGSFAYVPAEEEPSLFSGAYKNTSELVSEHKRYLKDILPEGMDFRRYIVSIEGIVRY